MIKICGYLFYRYNEFREACIGKYLSFLLKCPKSRIKGSVKI